MKIIWKQKQIAIVFILKLLKKKMGKMTVSEFGNITELRLNYFGLLEDVACSSLIACFYFK